MGFFSTSGSHFDRIQADCKSVSKLVGEARSRCDKSLRGKHEMMEPEERAGLLKQALHEIRDARKLLEGAKEHEHRMEQDQCPSEEILKAHARILEASLDIQRAEKSIEDGRRSLTEGLHEIEQFFGASSREAREVRKVIAEIEAG